MRQYIKALTRVTSHHLEQAVGNPKGHEVQARALRIHHTQLSYRGLCQKWWLLQERVCMVIEQYLHISYCFRETNPEKWICPRSEYSCGFFPSWRRPKRTCQTWGVVCRRRQTDQLFSYKTSIFDKFVMWWTHIFYVVRRHPLLLIVLNLDYHHINLFFSTLPWRQP